MRDFFEDFYFGRLTPSEQRQPVTAEMRKATKELTEAAQFLQDRLDGECADALQRLIKAQEDAESISCRMQFISGFKLGARFMLALLADENSAGERV